MTSIRGCSLFVCLLAVQSWNGQGAETDWRPLFNGTNLDGWHVVLGNSKSDDPEHLVKVDEGFIHMYDVAPDKSPQPAGYIVTDKEYSNYHLRLEYKWGFKRFAPQDRAKRDAGILYHVVGKEGVWPTSVECQIQENNVGDIFTVNTRLMAMVDPKTTNLFRIVTTHEAGLPRTNQSSPVFLEPDQGGIPFVQGSAGGIRRVIRNSMNERDGWNKVEVMVRGDSATFIVNGKVINRATNIQQTVNGEWVPLKKGRIALQLDLAEVYYRHIEIQELKEPESAL